MAMEEETVRQVCRRHPSVKNIGAGGGIHQGVLFVWGHSSKVGWPGPNSAVEDRIDVDLNRQTVQFVPGRSGGVMADPVALTPEALAEALGKMWSPRKTG